MATATYRTTLDRLTKIIMQRLARAKRIALVAMNSWRNAGPKKTESTEIELAGIYVLQTELLKTKKW